MNKTNQNQQDKKPKRKNLFFHSDVMDCVDYAECMAYKYDQPERFLDAVVKQIGQSRREHPIALPG